MDTDSKIGLNSSKSQSRKIEKESELLGTLSKQLYLAENQTHKLQSTLKKVEDRLKQKDHEINRLRKKVKDWELKEKCLEPFSKKDIQGHNIGSEKSDHTYKKCLKLEKKVLEMERFLADYGLVWVGGKHHGVIKDDDFYNNFIDNYFDKFIANIEELNSTIGRGEMFVCHNARGASFKTLPSITIKIYKNGMIVQKGRLRHYTDFTTRSFIKDILDGYFPSELQRDYPNGVSLKVEDLRTKLYLGEGTKYPGHGYQLGKLSSCDSLPSTGYSTKVKGKFTSGKPLYNNKSSLTSMKTSESSSHVRQSNSSLSDLRSHILASHNNNCSDIHLQSHLNAEIVTSARCEKTMSNVKSIECHAASKNRVCNCRHNISESESANINRNNRPVTLNRSSLGVSFRNDVDNRPKSVSSSRSCHFPKHSSTSPSIDDSIKFNLRSKYANENKNTKLRPSKSATLKRQDYEIPILQEVNKPTGAPGELRLKIRSMSGSVVYLVHISTDDNVGHLYHLLDTILMRRKIRMTPYKIVISGYFYIYDEYPEAAVAVSCQYHEIGLLIRASMSINM